jgi:hypothetical protein
MTTTSESARPFRRSAVLVDSLNEAPEPIGESIGVDDPGTAHGGRPRRMPGPPAPGGLVRRVRPLDVLPTRVRRIPGGTRGLVDAA